jgi:hypothetical protein
VFLETPSTRAISLIGMLNDLCNLRISAQSSTDNNPFLLGSTNPRSPEGVNIHRRHGVILQASPTADQANAQGHGRRTAGRTTERRVQEDPSARCSPSDGSCRLVRPCI